jgi:raffinose/stachyose/melibiose transport system substrate-binding protein
MMRNLVVILGGILALLLLPSCGREKTKQAEEGPAPVRLRFWHIMNYSGPREILAAAVQRFELQHPGCRVDIQTFENDAYKTKLAIEEASGSPPDVFFTWGGGPLLERARASRVLDLSDSVKENAQEGRFIDRALDLCRDGQQIYALPLDMSAVLLWCNRDLFQKYGLSYPTTFPELLQVCTKFREQGIVPFALGNMKQWTGAFYFCYLANRCGGTKLFLDAAHNQPGASFADPSFIQAGEYVQEMLRLQAFPNGCNGMDDGPARALFLRGEAAMHLMGTWLVARILDENPGFLAQLQAIPFPMVPGGQGDSSTLLGGINCAFAVSSTCQEPALACELLRFLTDDQVVSEWCRIGRLPAMRTTPEQEAQLPEATREALALLRSAASLQPYYDQYLSPRLAVEHKKTTHNLFAGTMTPQQAAEKMAATAAAVAR